MMYNGQKTSQNEQLEKARITKDSIQKAKQTDTSFTDRGFMNMFPPTYKQYEVRQNMV